MLDVATFKTFLPSKQNLGKETNENYSEFYIIAGVPRSKLLRNTQKQLKKAKKNFLL